MGAGAQLTLNLTLQYINELGPTFEENVPELRLFLDDNFRRKAVSVKQVEEGRDYRVTVAGGHAANRSIPVDAHLVVRAYAHMKNKAGVQCLNPAGNATFDLIAIHDAVVMGDKGEFSAVKPLRLHTAQGFEKGRVRITVTRGDGMTLDKPLKFDREVYDYSQVDENAKCHLKLMYRYITLTEEMADRIPLSFQSCASIRCPFDPSALGSDKECKMAPHGVMPAVAYVIAKTPASDEAYWYNAFQMALARMCKSESDFACMSVNEKAAVMARMVCLQTNMYDYISDRMDRNHRNQSMLWHATNGVCAVESFDECHVRQAGDCEDFAKGIMQALNSFREREREFEHPGLCQLHAIANQYIDLMALDGVTAAAVNDDAIYNGTSRLGAHMNVFLVPRRRVFEMLNAVLSERCQLTDEEEARCGGTPRWACNLKTLVCEGTGIFDPLGDVCDEKKLDAMCRTELVCGRPALKQLKKMIYHPRNCESSFFRTSMLGFTNWFFKRGYAFGSMIFVYKHGSRLSRGVKFLDLVNDDRRVALVAHPDLTPLQMNIVKHMTKDQIPTPDFEAPTQFDKEKQCWKRYEMERLCDYMRDVKRRCAQRCNEALAVRTDIDAEVPMAAIGSRRPQRRRVVSLYARPHQLSKQVLHDLCACIEKNEAVVDFGYEVEVMTNSVINYRLDFTMLI